EHLLVLVEALHGADGHAVGVLAIVAGLADGVRHEMGSFLADDAPLISPAVAPGGSAADEDDPDVPHSGWRVDRIPQFIVCLASSDGDVQRILAPTRLTNCEQPLPP